MQFSAEQYSRGFITWETEKSIFVCTTTTRTIGEQANWSSSLTDPTGSLVTSDALRYVAIQLGSANMAALPQSFCVRWERVVENRLITKVFDPGLPGDPMTLVYVPNFGIFHRLVVTAAKLQWVEDSVIRVGNIVIRFVEGVVYGERVQPIDQLSLEDGQVSLTGSFSGEVEAHGRFIEIVAPGADADRAEQQAYAILGGLALCLGDGAVGNVVFSEPHHAVPKGQTGEMHIPITAVVPVAVSADHFGEAARILPTYLEDDKDSRACRLALRWYERGLRASTAVDRLVGHFIGIEAVLKSHTRRAGPTKHYREQEKRFNEWLKSLNDPLDTETEKWLRQSAFSAPLAADFAFYVEQHSWESSLVEEFRLMRRLRNSIAHGDIATITDKEADDVQQLLRRLLATELEVTIEPPQSAYPDVRGITVGFQYMTGTNQEGSSNNTR